MMTFIWYRFATIIIHLDNPFILNETNTWIINEQKKATCQYQMEFITEDYLQMYKT
jgi:hypothetical protein